MSFDIQHKTHNTFEEVLLYIKTKAIGRLFKIYKRGAKMNFISSKFDVTCTLPINHKDLQIRPQIS